MIKKATYILLLLLLPIFVSAQRWSRYKYEGYYGIGLTNFTGDVSAPVNTSKFVWVNFFNTIGFAANAGLRYNFADRQYVRGNIFLGQLYAEDPIGNPNYWYRGIKFSSFFTEIAAKYEFMIWKEKKKSTVYRMLGETGFKNFSMPTYLFVGFGATFNAGNFSRIVDEGTSTEKEGYVNFCPTIPFGIGFKYRLGKLTYINLEAEWHFTITDGIDNAKGKDSPMYGEWFDQYQTITFNIIHKLRQNRNGMPKFRRKY